MRSGWKVYVPLPLAGNVSRGWRAAFIVNVLPADGPKVSVFLAVGGGIKYEGYQWAGRKSPNESLGTVSHYCHLLSGTDRHADRPAGRPAIVAASCDSLGRQTVGQIDGFQLAWKQRKGGVCGDDVGGASRGQLRKDTLTWTRCRRQTQPSLQWFRCYISCLRPTADVRRVKAHSKLHWTTTTETAVIQITSCSLFLIGHRLGWTGPLENWLCLQWDQYENTEDVHQVVRCKMLLVEMLNR